MSACGPNEPVTAAAASGHEDQFPPGRLNVPLSVQLNDLRRDER
jgi:hypothetical protein